LTWLEKAALPSLAQPRNRESLNDSTFVVVTKPIHQARIDAALKNSGIKYRDVEYLMLGDDFEKNPHSAGAYMKNAFVMELGKALMLNSRILIVPPDTIWGEGSVPNLMEIARQRDSVVFAAHVRVLPELVDDCQMSWAGNRFGPNAVSNAKLVKMAFKHLHKTWEESQDGLQKINSYIGGVLWRYLDEDLYAVNHRLPTPYLINPTPEDVTYFSHQLHFGVLDHSWPAACLVETERMRVVGSSDCAFMVELTDKEANIPPIEHYRADEPDLFWRNLSHNKVNRMYSIIFRGE
jgi:hypothetical protein